MRVSKRTVSCVPILLSGTKGFGRRVERETFSGQARNEVLMFSSRWDRGLRFSPKDLSAQTVRSLRSECRIAPFGMQTALLYCRLFSRVSRPLACSCPQICDWLLILGASSAYGAEFAPILNRRRPQNVHRGQRDSAGDGLRDFQWPNAK
jgi:hypothetical protein